MHYMQINRGHNRILYSWKVSTVKTGPQDIKAICTQIQNYDTSTEILKQTHFHNQTFSKQSEDKIHTEGFVLECELIWGIL